MGRAFPVHKLPHLLDTCAEKIPGEARGTVRPWEPPKGKGESTQQEEQGSAEQGVVVRGRGSLRKGSDFWQGWEGWMLQP